METEDQPTSSATLLEDGESTQQVSSPSNEQLHKISREDGESTQQVSSPSNEQLHKVSRKDDESTQQVSSPSNEQLHKVSREDGESTQQVSSPSNEQPHKVSREDGESTQQVSSPSNEQLHKISREMFHNLSTYLQTELSGTKDTYSLLEELNGIAIDQYSNLSHSTSQIKDSLHDLDVKYKLLLPYLEQLNQLDVSVASLEQATLRLDAYTKVLESKFKKLEKR